MTPDLDTWLPDPALRVQHRRESSAGAERLWEAARSVRLSDTRMLGRMVRWRSPGLPPDLRFDDLFRTAPFSVLCDGDGALVSGLVGRIWTLKRDYPRLAEPEAFVRWSARGTVRVLLANWVEPAGDGAAALVSESRIGAIDAQSRIGLAAVRPLVAASHHLVGSEGIAAAVRRAEGGG
jgi:hypothetical protein